MTLHSALSAFLADLINTGAQGRCIRRLRKQKNLTLRRLAALASITPTFLSDIERGNRRASDGVLQALAKPLGTTLEALLELDDRVVVQAVKELCDRDPALALALRSLSGRLKKRSISVTRAVRTIKAMGA